MRQFEKKHCRFSFAAFFCASACAPGGFRVPWALRGLRQGRRFAGAQRVEEPLREE
jgi:hypothetical protein